MSEYQALMEGLFPEREIYGANSMHPVVIGYSDGQIPQVCFLIIADDYLGDPFVTNPGDEVSVGVNTLGVANENGHNKDLRFRVEFIYPDTQPSFVAEVPGNLPEQERLIQALGRVNEITFFVANLSLSLIAVVRIPWDYNRHEDTFRDIRAANELAMQR